MQPLLSTAIEVWSIVNFAPAETVGTTAQNVFSKLNPAETDSAMQRLSRKAPGVVVMGTSCPLFASFHAVSEAPIIA